MITGNVQKMFSFDDVIMTKFLTCDWLRGVILPPEPQSWGLDNACKLGQSISHESARHMSANYRIPVISKSHTYLYDSKVS